jgi:regulator of replication initiation timing
VSIKSGEVQTRLEELEEENLNLRIENEYLKKLNALVAEREKRERESR